MNPSVSTFPVSDIRTLDALSGVPSYALLTRDAASATGLAYLIGELEKRDPKVREPLTSVTWARDIVAKTGGGWVEFTSTLNVSYANAGPNGDGVIGSQANNIPVVQADLGKDVYKVFTWANIMKIPFVDQAKLQNIGRSLDDILDKGVRLNFNKTVDLNVYKGFANYGTTGLVNDPGVTAASAPNGASGQALWNKKTAQEILNDINQVMVDGWAASEYDLSGMPNHILIPPSQYAYLVANVVSAAGNRSILDFLLENNIGRNQGVNLRIEPSRWCIGAGAGATDRLVAYVNDEDRVYFDMPVPLSRIMTQPVVQEVAYLTAYAGQLGVVKFLFLQPPRYLDGI